MINLPNIFIPLGIFLGVLFSHHQFKKYLSTIKSKSPIDTNDFLNTTIIVTLFSLVGGRLYHILNFWEYYQQNPSKTLFFWNGGFGVMGAILFGLLGLTIFSLIRRGHHYQTVILTDLIALGLPLAQAAGRWSSYFNYNFLGIPTKLPWGIEIPFFARPQGYKLYTTYHPLFLYESLLNLILFAFLYLVFIKIKKRRDGTIVLIYLTGFSLIKLFTEPMLIGSWKIGVFPVASVISFTMLIASSILLAVMYIPKLLTKEKPLVYNKPVVENTVKKSNVKRFRVQHKRKAK